MDGCYLFKYLTAKAIYLDFFLHKTFIQEPLNSENQLPFYINSHRNRYR